MAKLAGSPLGGWSGKAGSMVYSTIGGVQVARAYQPVVANPSTRAQEVNRKRLYLVGKISKAISRDVIHRGSAAVGRRRLLKNLFEGSSIDANNGDIKITASSLVLSEGFEFDSSIIGLDGSTANRVRINVSQSSIPKTYYAVESVCVYGRGGIDLANVYRSSVKRVILNPGSDVPATIEFPMTANDSVFVYICFARVPESAWGNMSRGAGIDMQESVYLASSNENDRSYLALEWSRSELVHVAIGSVN